MRCVRVWCVSSSVVSKFLWRHGLYPSKLLCPWHFPGKNTGIGCLFLVQRTFLTQELDLHLLHLLHCRQFFTSSIRFIYGYIMDIVLLHIWVSSPQPLCKLFKESDLYLFILVSSTVPCFNENLHWNKMSWKESIVSENFCESFNKSIFHFYF